MKHLLNRHFIRILFFVFSIFLALPSQAQEETDTLMQKVKVKAYIPFVIGDSVYRFNHDTTLYLPPDLVNHDSTAVLQSQQFYENLQKTLGKRRITKELSNLLLRKQQINSESDDVSTDILSTGMCFEGKIVRSITYVRLPPFGADVKTPDPIITTRFTRYANGVHSKTKERVIDKNIVFNVGDVVSDTDFSDSERILRALSFIKDALIYACEVDDSHIDIYIITQDQWTIGVDGNYSGFNDFELGLYNSNFVGTGQYVYLGAVVKTDEPEPIGYNFEYRFQNIQGTFINLDINAHDNYLQSLWGFNLYKDFITSNTKTAGAMVAESTFTRYGFATSDSAYMEIDSTERFWEPLEYSYTNAWIGRSMHLNQKPNQNITLSGSVEKIQFFQRPAEVSADTLYNYHNRTQYASSLTINERNYRKLKYLQGFGRTEDVPYGWLISVTGGWENNEFHNMRPYLGMALDVGQFTSYGYFKLRGEVGAFLTEVYRQETYHLNFQYFSNLIAVNDNYFRFLLDIDFMDGNDRIPGDYLYFLDDNIYTDFQINRFTKKGTQRLQLKQENVWFTPWFFYGFKFAVYQNIELGYLSDIERISLSEDNLFSAFGVGIRTRNENLVFNTLTLDLKYFPNANNNNSPFQVLLSTQIDLPLRDFKPTKPQFLRFQ